MIDHNDGAPEPSRGEVLDRAGDKDVPPSTTERELGKAALWTSLGICLAGSAVCFLARVPLLDRKWATFAEISTHVGVAFLVAGILLVTLEFNAKRLLHREVREFLDLVAKNVYKALLERIVPPEIFAEMNDLLRAKVIRRHCEYVITFAKPTDDLPAGYFVIRRSLSFRVENLLNISTTFPVRSVYVGYVNEEDPTVDVWKDRSYHTGLFINNKEIPIVKGQNLSVDGDVIILDQALHLAPKGWADVILLGEEPCRTAAGKNGYVQGTPVIGIRVNVVNEFPEEIGESTVLMHHPASGKMEHFAALNRYSLDHAFLPGQSFEVRWKIKSTSPLEPANHHGPTDAPRVPSR
jgi:hypothetical protein